MKEKETVIKDIMDRVDSVLSNNARKVSVDIEACVRNAYNEGYRKCEKEKASEYQRGYAEAEAHYKDIIEMREKQAFENGYKKCLEENDLYDENVFDGNYKVGDEVIADSGTACFVITSTNGNDIGGIDATGNTYAYLPSEICYKTGRHFDIKSFLKQMEAPTKDTITNAEKFYEVFGRDISVDYRLDKDGRAFTICGDKTGTLMMEEWLYEEYERKET